MQREQTISNLDSFILHHKTSHFKRGVSNFYIHYTVCADKEPPVEFSMNKLTTRSHLLKLISDGLRFLMPLEPHHVLCVEPPGLLFQGFGCQILSFCALPKKWIYTSYINIVKCSVCKRSSRMNAYLKVVENEEERLCGQPLVELHTVRVWWWHLVMERQCRTGIPHQVLPVCGGKTTQVQTAHHRQNQKVTGVNDQELLKT